MVWRKKRRSGDDLCVFYVLSRVWILILGVYILAPILAPVLALSWRQSWRQSWQTDSESSLGRVLADITCFNVILLEYASSGVSDLQAFKHQKGAPKHQHKFCCPHETLLSAPTSSLFSKRSDSHFSRIRHHSFPLFRCPRLQAVHELLLQALKLHSGSTCHL